MKKLKKPTIYLASDHAGFALKEQLKQYLIHLGYNCKDCGPFTPEPLDDYPDYMIPAAQEVARHPGSRGIFMGGSGQGESIVANKVKGVRAAVYYGGNLEVVRLSRDHNDANVLCLGARFVSEAEAKKAVKLWLETSFSGAIRHKRRLQKIRKFEQAC
ncbi:MAG TPA: RpiB/LacA/LacB family sugar-phosphate isomerase [Candidatus Nanoarchaeia archaeon]|nr:RpiB/LacA/LacB family sugar-phosphate isomerase [Candidatus Nanoarchaeia archaeon]